MGGEGIEERGIYRPNRQKAMQTEMGVFMMTQSEKDENREIVMMNLWRVSHSCSHS